MIEWVDPLGVWEAHQSGADRSEDLKVLCSLELYLAESRADEAVGVRTR